MRIFAAMFSRRWWWTTLLVVLGAAVCVRLGFWQLNRLEQRRAFNAHVQRMWASSPLSLPADASEDLLALEYRAVQARGVYDFEHQIALRNQYWRGRPGYHLLTPLVMQDGQAILVDRGWIPYDGNGVPEAWRAYDEPGEVRVGGIIRLGQAESFPVRVGDPESPYGETRRVFWNLLVLEGIAEQVPYPLLPVYIQVDADLDDITPPIPSRPEVELTEGPHLGYAGQWFTFAAILFFGYPFFLRRRLLEEM